MMTSIFHMASHCIPHWGLFSQEAFLIGCILVLIWGYCLTLYMEPNILHANRKRSSGVLLGMSFPLFPLNIPFHDDPIYIRIVQLVNISCVVICVANHNGLVHIVRHLFLNIVPCNYLSDKYKL